MKRLASLTTVLLAVLELACGGRKPPLSPAEALKTFRLPPGFRIELVASEPQVLDPVAMAFDERGRLFVVEMPDYPLNPQPLGSVRLLEDRDGDGRFERHTVFVDKLHMPTGVMPWRNGILVAAVPDILFFADTDGDNRADVRRVVLTGFAATNPQLRVNGLIYGIDNWIYAAYPRVPTPARYVKEFGDPGSPLHFPDHPEVPAIDPRGLDIRFRPDKAKLEIISGNSQFGNAFDAWGGRFTVWNNDHIRHVVLSHGYLSRNPFLAAGPAQESASDHETASAVYAITQDPQHIHDSQVGHFTSACGLGVYTGGAWPAGYDGSSFTCEPVHNLVHRDVLEPAGATFRARRGHDGFEFLASTDSWFRPVFTTVGPDGAFYIVDYYRAVVEHPEFVPEEMLRDIDFAPGANHGRIWRVVHESARPAPRPQLHQAATADLVRQLADLNSWRRLTAQRLLADRNDRDAIPLLDDLRRRGSPVARLHALWTLDAIAALDQDRTMEALTDTDPHIREHAIRLAELRLADTRVKARLLALADDPDPHVELQAALTLGSLPFAESFPVLDRVLARHLEDKWFQLAVLSSAAETAGRWFRALTARPDSLGSDSKAKQEFLRQLASILGARQQDAEIAAVLSAVAGARAPGAWWPIATLEGLADGLRRGDRERPKLSASQPVLLRLLDAEPRAVAKAALRIATRATLTESATLAATTKRASTVALDPAAKVPERAHAAGILGLDPTGRSASLLEKLLNPQQPEDVQVAAVSAIGNLRHPRVAAILLEPWRSYTAPVRDAVLAVLFAERARLPALIDAIRAEKVQPWSLPLPRRRQLMRHPEPEIRDQAKTLLAKTANGDRKVVYEKYRASLRLTGKPDRGHQVFERACAECHKIGIIGHEVGPDLRSVTRRNKEVLLTDILLPNESLEAGYTEYLVETKDGRQISGVIAEETPTTLVVRRAKGEQDTVARSTIASLRSLSVSPMPEDLEKSITVEQMADLLAYLKSLK